MNTAGTAGTWGRVRPVALRSTGGGADKFLIPVKTESCSSVMGGAWCIQPATGQSLSPSGDHG